ncbi:MAG: hypothetical protein RL398_134 [Planctomycetota bacterium]
MTERARFSTASTSAWVLYDLANTVYAATVTFLFTPHARQVLGDRIGSVGTTNLVSMAIAALLVPIAGAIADRTGRAHLYLTAVTLACIAAMLGMALDWGPGWLLLCFAVANITYNLGLLYYNALLPAVASPERTGLVSGIGVGVGYLGTILVLATLLPRPELGSSRFAIAALMFLVVAAPCMLLVRAPRAAKQPAAAPVRQALAGLRDTLRTLPQHRNLLWFLVGNFCLVDVLNTAVLYFADFTRGTFRRAAEAGELQLFGHHFDGAAGMDSFVIVAGLLLNLAALACGLLSGRFTDRHPLGVMRGSAVALLVALVGGSWFAGASALGYLTTLVLCGALGLAGIWTAGRKVLLLLAPPEHVGEYFGLYGITVKLSVVGAFTFAQVDDALGPRAAMLVQAIPLLIGLACLCIVRVPKAAIAAASSPAR